MVKNKSSPLSFILFILIILVAASAYFFYANWQSVPETLIPTTQIHNSINSSFNSGNVNSNTRSKQFYPNMRFPDKSITYKIEDVCSENKANEVQSSLHILEDNTVLKFHQVQAGEDAELEVICSNNAPEPTSKDHYVAGEGGPTDVLNATLFSVIEKAQISLYRDERCDSPHISMHEILHALGFDHNNNPQSILYPTLDCSQEVDSYLYQDLNTLYSIPSQADLAISSVNATKTSRYLNFNIEVLNRGLADANSVTLTVYADNSLVKNFDLQTIEIGTRKLLTVENLHISSGTEKIKFTLDKDSKIEELYEDNNNIELILSK